MMKLITANMNKNDMDMRINTWGYREGGRIYLLGPPVIFRFAWDKAEISEEHCYICSLNAKKKTYCRPDTQGFEECKF